MSVNITPGTVRIDEIEVLIATARLAGMRIRRHKDNPFVIDCYNGYDAGFWSGNLLFYSTLQDFAIMVQQRLYSAGHSRK